MPKKKLGRKKERKKVK